MELSSAVIASQENELIKLYESIRESVIYISRINQAFNPLMMNMMEVPSLSGSGFVWQDEFIVTNNHVVDGQNEVLVTFIRASDGERKSFRARVKGGDKEKDIAVLELVKERDSREYKVPQPLLLAASSKLRVGQFVIALGNPFGLETSLTTGIISGLGRQLQGPGGNVFCDMIQTDAAINPGNSGGPLLNSAGQLIGMNTAIYSTSGAFSGVGFAIPADILKVVVDVIIKKGVFSKPKTGLEFVGGYQAKLLGVDGLLVLNVAPGSPAEVSGIRPVSKSAFLSSADIASADVIKKVNGKPVLSEADFLQATYGNTPGDVISIVVKRAVVTTAAPAAQYTQTNISNDQSKKVAHREVTLQLRLS